MLFGVLIALIPLFIGYLIKLSNKAWLNKINQSLSLIIYLILFLMGSELAQLDDLLSHLTTIISSTLLLFICTFGLNMVFLLIFDIALPWRNTSPSNQELASRFKMILESLRICLALILGFICGLIPSSIWQYNDLSSKVILVILLVLVGIQLRSNNITLKQILINKVGMITTLTVIFSALLGGIAVSYLLSLPMHTTMAMSSGFGWYSLSGILMTEAQGPIIGSITFLNDIMRELCAIILIPSLIRRFKLTSLGICGATSMDFTLPMLQKGGGIMIVPPAIVQGFLLTLIMPILMSFLNYYF
ncbi:lysine exporter LysO family protein [Orbus sturtevantii]|uniref:lysine exporter LysO family protein n=1 Tax=Orbus sturtevantii TaxID=3074109 RepID=UPI00370DDE7C